MPTDSMIPKVAVFSLLAVVSGVVSSVLLNQLNKSSKPGNKVPKLSLYYFDIPGKVFNDLLITLSRYLSLFLMAYIY